MVDGSRSRNRVTGSGAARTADRLAVARTCVFIAAWMISQRVPHDITRIIWSGPGPQLQRTDPPLLDRPDSLRNVAFAGDAGPAGSRRPTRVPVTTTIRTG